VEYLMKRLVIVESPTKAKTLSPMLGAGYTVRASMGHVRDLPTDELGVDIEHSFKPTYHILRQKSKTLKALRAALEEASELYLATDPDREGEAIAWHLLQTLKPKDKVIQRVTFHEITPGAIQTAFAQPHAGVDMDLVNAQQARRVLDRLVGYQVSPLLWKTTGGKSAGRVQSVALRLVVDREREIAAFVPVEYWSIHADLAKVEDHTRHFLARLVQIGSQKVGLDQPIHLKTKEEAERIISELEGTAYRVKDVRREKKIRKPWPPFTTSTLQQAASARLRMPPGETMKIAQELYEGIDIGEGKPVGLITYMRTDSTAVSPEAQAAARKWIEETLGRQYLPDTPPSYKTKVKNAQEAHEAIRPTGVARTPDKLKPHLSERQFKVYDLIWRRFVASQMSPAVYDVTTVNVIATVEGKPPFLFRATGRTLLFDGFLKVWQESEEKAGEDEDEPQALPELSANEPLDLLALIPRQHFTQPPSRYTEATLIKALEDRGIGRPSTYASIVATLKEREYVYLDGCYLRPTPLGEATCDALIAAFPDLMDYTFTAQVEDWLDDVSRGEKDWVAALREFYDPFSQALAQAPAKMAAIPKPAISIPSAVHPPQPAADSQGTVPRPTRGDSTLKKPRRKAARRSKAKGPVANEPGVVCPLCGAPMVRRTGKHGAFLGCSRYPECKGTRNLQMVNSTISSG
jgi:DNA topoisomerase I